MCIRDRAGSRPARLRRSIRCDRYPTPGAAPSPREVPPARSPARLVGRFGVCANNGERCTPYELR
eukprot:13022579-Alexandrium_andersonii.AAC.1